MTKTTRILGGRKPHRRIISNLDVLTAVAQYAHVDQDISVHSFIRDLFKLVDPMTQVLLNGLESQGFIDCGTVPRDTYHMHAVLTEKGKAELAYRNQDEQL